MIHTQFIDEQQNCTNSGAEPLLNRFSYIPKHLEADFQTLSLN